MEGVTWSKTTDSEATCATIHVTHLHYHYPSSSEACSLGFSRLSRGSLVVARMGLGAGAGPPDPSAVL
jgi:hypothetical protein